MPIEQVGKYEIEYEAAALPDDGGWAAYVAVFGASDNPAHRNSIMPRERVGVAETFKTEAEALEAALRIGLTMLS